jgi:hypothetical protein
MEIDLGDVALSKGKNANYCSLARSILHVIAHPADFWDGRVLGWS